jgi:hypothetical protein
VAIGVSRPNADSSAAPASRHPVPRSVANDNEHRNSTLVGFPVTRRP